MTSVFKKYLICILIVLAYLIPLVLENVSNSNIDFNGYRIGQILGFLAITGLCIQLVLSSRLMFMEKKVGLDRIMHWHGLNARLVTIFVLLHPLFLNVSLIIGGLGPADLLSGYYWPHYFGIIAVATLLLVVVLSVYGERFKLAYQTWQATHKLVYVVVILGIIHSFSLGSNIYSRGFLFYWWCGLIVISVMTIAYRYAIRPLTYWRNKYHVVDIRQESPNVRTIDLVPNKHKGITFIPGQFAYVRFISDVVAREEHHFTIASAPQADGTLSFTVKELGDYTRSLKDLKVGDRATVEGPYGVFTCQDQVGPFVFIAGGIGITPIMSMLRGIRTQKDKPNVKLIYANKTILDIVFKRELDDMATEGWLNVSYVLSDDAVEGYYHGHISEEILKKETTNLENPTFYIVGPVPMMESVAKSLAKMGVKKSKIKMEKFSLK